MLEAAARSVQAEPEGAEGAAQSSPRLPLLGLGVELGAGDRWCWRWRWSLLHDVRRLQTTADISALYMQEVTAGSKGTDTKGAEGAAGDVPAVAQGGPLLGGAVDEQAAVAVVTVAGGVEAAAQLSLVLWVAEGHVELVEAVGELAALGVLAEAVGRVAGAELRLVAGGAHPGDEGRGGGVHQGEQGLSQGEAFYTRVSIRILAGQQVVHHLLVLVGRQEQGVTTGLQER